MIQDTSDPNQWQNVLTKENPADLVSRGLLPSEIIQNQFWWEGPLWLKSVNLPFGPIPGSQISDPEVQLTSMNLNISIPLPWFDEFAARFSSLKKLLRITVYVRRLLHPTSHATGMLSEIESSLIYWVMKTQYNYFQNEIQSFNENNSVLSNSKILPLCPIINSVGALCVGGRLHNAEMSEDQKHPMILPGFLMESSTKSKRRVHPFTYLLVESYHQQYLHAGPKLLFSILRQRFWILNSKSIIRRCFRNCVKCQRQLGISGKQLMGNLPSSRVVPTSRAFMKVGVDYAGPIHILPIRGRGQITVKSWIAVFICLTTKAVHLELANELSTDSFNAALERFVARRGKPSDIFSDNGTNFEGASNEMKKFMKEVYSSANANPYLQALAADGIKFHFNPPAAPHMGGLWEAAVKSMKILMVKSSPSENLTDQEMCTLLCGIEACLNSRPLTPMSDDLEDINVLTPAHFLIGDSLTAVSKPDYSDSKFSILDRYQRIQFRFQQFWRRWSTEFLITLQQRPKWMKEQSNLKEGDLVIVKEESLPPLKWKIARVISVHPGKDEKVRVATIRTATVKITKQKPNQNRLDRFKTHISEFQRPITKLCLLPSEIQNVNCEV